MQIEASIEFWTLNLLLNHLEECYKISWSHIFNRMKSDDEEDEDKDENQDDDDDDDDKPWWKIGQEELSYFS